MKKRIVIHCSAGPQTQTAAQIIEWHTRPASRGGRGWSRAGYHYIIEASGRVVNAVPEEQVANGAKGFNDDSIHVCYIGGADAKGRPIDNRTAAQKRSMRELVEQIRGRHPGLTVVGHRDLSPDIDGNGRIDRYEWIKGCPSFNVRDEFT